MKVITITIDMRKRKALDIQSIITKYGEEIHSRIGYHNIENDSKGLIIIIYTGKNAEKFCEELKEQENVKINCVDV